MVRKFQSPNTKTAQNTLQNHTTVQTGMNEGKNMNLKKVFDPQPVYASTIRQTSYNSIQISIVI